jgi:RNA polymerase sigma factor (sigma-70 family)
MSRHEFRHVATCLLRPESRLIQPTDSELLARFVNTRDEKAFAELVARHSGLVRGTARRCLRDPHAAEDVYQATFMTLAKKAGGVRWMSAIGPWLHATAAKLSRKALSRMRPVNADLPTEVFSSDVDPATSVAWGEVCRIVDEELLTLSENLRVPLVLCYLQGFTRDEAAQAIGCSLAMLKRYLERGRRLLSDRLMRRGVTLPAAGLGILAGDLAVNASTIDGTTRAAVAFATQGVASPGTAGLLQASHIGLKLKTVTLIATIMGMLACGITFATFSSPSNSEQSDAPQQQPHSTAKTDDMPREEAPGEALPPAAIARLGSVRLRAGGPIGEMIFSSDGTKLITSTSTDLNDYSTLTIRDVKTGRSLSRFDMPVR